MERRQAAISTGDRALAVDLTAVAAVGAGICAGADRPGFMAALVGAAIALRFIAWARLPIGERGTSLGVELAFFAICLGLGAFNDWSSVVRHRIYDYDVPSSLAGGSGVPPWMLAYWGLILRSIATLCGWRRLAASTAATRRRRNPLHLVAVEILLVLATRQLLYRYFLDPVLSWLPFALALAAYVALFGLTAREIRLVAIAALVGPAVEAAYIHLGGLHHYHLGLEWLGGVPLWILLWWMLAVLVWNDLSARLLSLLDSFANRAAGLAGDWSV